MALAIGQPKFSQATIVTATLLAAWLLWLAANSKLLIYWWILIGKSGGVAGAGATPSGPVTSVTGTPGASATATVTQIMTPAQLGQQLGAVYGGGF
jgi:hypothetical protein